MNSVDLDFFSYCCYENCRGPEKEKTYFDNEDLRVNAVTFNTVELLKHMV